MRKETYSTVFNYDTKRKGHLEQKHKEIKSFFFSSAHFNKTEGQAYACVLNHLCSCPQYNIILPFTATPLHCGVYDVEANSWGFPVTNICFI